MGVILLGCGLLEQLTVARARKVLVALLARVPEILAPPRRALRVTWQNVLRSVAINLLAVLLAGLRIVTPIQGAIIHGASTGLVVLNAVRVIECRPAAAS